MSATGAYRAIILRWTNPSDVDLARVQVWVSLTNDRDDAMLVDTPSASPGMQQRWVHTGREPDVTNYYWIRPQDYSGNLSVNYTPASPTAGWSAAATSVPGGDVISGLRVVVLVDAATVTPNADTTDLGTLATLSQATLFANPTGTPLDGQLLAIRILSSTARVLTWGAQYRSTTGFPLPTSTTGGGIPDYVVFRRHASDSRWDCVLQTISMGIPDASETVKGIAELATQAETDAGTDALRIITALKLAASTTVVHPARSISTTAPLTGGGDLSANRTFAVSAASETASGVSELATQAETNTGTDDVRSVTPLKLATSTSVVHPARSISTTAPLAGGGDLSGDRTLTVGAASDTASGVAELATAAETTTGTDATRAVTPDGLAGSAYGTAVIGILVTDPQGSVLTTGDLKAYVRIPVTLNGWNLIGVAGHVSTVSSSGTITVQIRNVTDTVDMLSTALTIDASEKDSATAAAAAVINASTDDVATADEIAIDVDSSGVGAKGLFIELRFQLP